jgi:hypothetical protein
LVIVTNRSGIRYGIVTSIVTSIVALIVTASVRSSLSGFGRGSRSCALGHLPTNGVLRN